MNLSSGLGKFPAALLAGLTVVGFGVGGYYYAQYSNAQAQTSALNQQIATLSQANVTVREIQWTIYPSSTVCCADGHVYLNSLSWVNTGDPDAHSTKMTMKFYNSTGSFLCSFTVTLGINGLIAGHTTGGESGYGNVPFNSLGTCDTGQWTAETYTVSVTWK